MFIKILIKVSLVGKLAVLSENYLAHVIHVDENVGRGGEGWRDLI